MECNYTRLSMSCKRRDHSLNIPGRIYTVGHTCTCTYPCVVNVFPGSKPLPRRRCLSLGLVHHFKLKLPSHTRPLSRWLPQFIVSDACHWRVMAVSQTPNDQTCYSYLCWIRWGGFAEAHFSPRFSTSSKNCVIWVHMSVQP